MRLLCLALIGLLPTALAARVEVQGLDKVQRANVMAWLSIAELPEDVGRSALYRRHRRARKEIRTALQALGHYRPQIDTHLHIGENDWLARYRVDAGPRTLIRDVTIDYRGPGADTLRQSVPPPAWRDQPLDHGAYEALKERLLNSALAAGYLDAELSEARLLIDVEADRADVRLAVETGPQYVFGEIRIEQDILAPKFLDNYVHVRPGDRYSSDRLLALQLRLTDLDYFQSLEVDTQRPEDPPPRVDVTITTEPRPPQRYQVGAGYGTDTGPRLSLKTEFRHLNRYGHRLQSELRIAEIQRQINAQYLIPTGREIGANWSLQSQYLQERFADSRTEDFRFGLARTLVDGPRLWQLYLNYQLENFTVGEERAQTELLLPGLSLTLRQADDSLNPRRGYRLFADLKGAHNDIASSDSFVQTELRARWMQPLSGRSRLLLRGRLGHSFVGAISDLPLSQRFFAGGDQSVRGYAYQSLGPRDADGDVIGGKYLGVFSVEVDRLLWRNYGAAVFYDYGGASDQPLEDLQRGVGIGFRWRTGIGMLRADVARPLDLPEDGFRVHIGIGAEL